MMYLRALTVGGGRLLCRSRVVLGMVLRLFLRLFSASMSVVVYHAGCHIVLTVEVYNDVVYACDCVQSVNGSNSTGTRTEL
jgi:hypothetical protein